MNSIDKSFVNKYKKNGFCYGIEIFSENETNNIRSEIEDLELKFKNGVSGQKLDQYFRVNGHIVIPLLANLSKSPKILDDSNMLPDAFFHKVKNFSDNAKIIFVK